MIASTVFDVCFLAPVCLFLAFLAIMLILTLAAAALGFFENRPDAKPKKAKKLKKTRPSFGWIPSTPNRYESVDRIFCANCGELILVSKEAVRAAETASVYIRCACGAVVEPKE